MYDVYEYMIKFVAIEDILNMLSVNKRMNNEVVLRRVMQKRFPLLSRFKKRKAKWRPFYAKMLYYISKIFKNIPYMEHLSLNPEKFYKYGKDKQLAKYALQNSRLDIYFTLEKGITDFNSCLIYAVKSENIDIVQLILDRNVSKIERALFVACKRGLFSIVKLLVIGRTLMNWEYEKAVRNCFKGGHMNIVDYLLKNNYFMDSFIYSAARYGYLDIVKKWIKPDMNINKIAIKAAKGGHLEIISYILLENKTTDYITIILIASQRGHLNVIKFLIDKTPGCEGNYAWSAAKHGQKTVVDYFINEKGYTDYNRLLSGAAIGGQIEMVKKLITEGATDIVLALENASLSGHLDTVRFLLKQKSEFGNCLFKAEMNTRNDVVEISNKKNIYN